MNASIITFMSTKLFVWQFSYCKVRQHMVQHLFLQYFQLVEKEAVNYIDYQVNAHKSVLQALHHLPFPTNTGRWQRVQLVSSCNQCGRMTKDIHCL